LGAELVLLNFYGGPSLLQASDSPSGDELQLTLVIELGGPADGKLETLAGNQYLVCSEEHAVAADVDRLPSTFLVAVPLVENPVADLTLDGKPIGASSLNTSVVSSY
jgi:hypothetical protein